MVPRWRQDADGNLDDGQEVDITQMGMPSDFFSRKMFIDIYLGKGKNDPPFAQRISDLEGDMADVKKGQSRQERLAWAILLTLFTVLLTVVFKK